MARKWDGRLTALTGTTRGVVLVVSEVVGLVGDQADQRRLFAGGGDAVGLEGGDECRRGLRGGAAFGGVGSSGAGVGFGGDLEELGGCDGGGCCGGCLCVWAGGEVVEGVGLGGGGEEEDGGEDGCRIKEHCVGGVSLVERSSRCCAYE